MSDSAGQGGPVEPEARYRAAGKGWRVILVLLTGLGILVVVNQVFLLKPLTGVLLIENSYLYVLMASFLSQVFVLFAATKRAPQDRVPWYDVGLFLLTIAVCAYLAWNGLTIIVSAFEIFAPPHFTAAAVVLWLLVLEACRRTGGTALFILVLVFSLYPLYAGLVPGVLSGLSLGFLETARFHGLSIQSIVGVPMGVVGTLLVGFIIMGMTLAATGGGAFFINLASALMGTYRGGPAKVCIMASALFGTMSGSVTSNVLTIGTLTIPAMKRAGYPPAYAAAIETCASTGGVLMPPVMGATAFLMASFLGIPYAQVAIAAVIPSVLYYLGLVLQVDAYAARVGLKGLSREELPSLWVTLRQGWFYLIAVVLLVWLLLYLKQEVLAPFYTTAFLLVLVNVRKETRLTFRKVLAVVELTGRTLAELVGILTAVGLIMGALSVTGMAATLAGDLVQIAGDNVILLLVMGAVASFILGMGMTMIACYVILAMVLAPALVTLGLNPVTVHLFILYWGMVSFITPPVAIGAYVAASVANAPPMQTGLQAMRLGAVIYFLPFIFVFDPVLTLQGVVTLGGLSMTLGTALAGVFLIACGLQGYLIGVGVLGNGLLGWLSRFLLMAGGLLLAYPDPQSSLAGLIIAGPVVLGYLIFHRRARQRQTTEYGSVN